MLHKDYRDGSSLVAVVGELGVFELDQIYAALQTQGPDEIRQSWIAVLRDLPWHCLKHSGIEALFVLIHHVDLAEDLVQSLVVDPLVGFAKASQHEIHPVRHRAAEIVDSHRAAV